LHICELNFVGLIQAIGCRRRAEAVCPVHSRSSGHFAFSAVHCVRDLLTKQSSRRVAGPRLR